MKRYIIILLILMACSPDNTVSIPEETPKEETVVVETQQEEIVVKDIPEVESVVQDIQDTTARDYRYNRGDSKRRDCGCGNSTRRNCS